MFFNIFREINLSVIAPYVDYLIEKQNVKCVFGKSVVFRTEGFVSAVFEINLFLVVNGTTGEGCSLTVDERKQLAAAWCQHGKGK